MMLPFLFVQLAEMVMMFCSYAQTISKKLRFDLLPQQGTMTPCRALSVLGQQVSKKGNRNHRNDCINSLASGCFYCGLLVRGGSTVFAGGTPPSKAQEQDPHPLHYVALNFRADITFRFWGFAV